MMTYARTRAIGTHPQLSSIVSGIRRRPTERGDGSQRWLQTLDGGAECSSVTPVAPASSIPRESGGGVGAPGR